MLRLNGGTLHASNNSCRVEVAGDQWATDRRRPIAAQMTRLERHVHQISLFSTNSRKLNTRQFGFVVCSERTSVRPLRMDESGDITLRISSNTECVGGGWPNKTTIQRDQIGHMMLFTILYYIYDHYQYIYIV